MIVSLVIELVRNSSGVLDPIRAVNRALKKLALFNLLNSCLIYVYVIF